MNYLLFIMKLIGDKAALLKAEGVNAENIENLHHKQISTLHLKSFY